MKPNYTERKSIYFYFLVIIYVKIMSNKKNIGIIIHRTDESMCQNLLNSLADVMVPDGYEVIVTVLDNSPSKATSYNEGMQQSNGEIKL